MSLPKFTMPFEPMTIEHLGLRLYSALPPVISELVSNAYDAESPKVEVILPQGPITEGTEVIVRDYGHGMAAQEVQDEFLPIGRNRRGPKGDLVMSKNGKVRVTGRKGLGKLSALGVATEVQVRSVRGGQAVCLRINYDDMMRWAGTHPLREPYEPTLVAAHTGPTKDANGVEVTLRKLHRRKGISVDQVREGLARRLRMIGPAFQVLVNGTPIGVGERRRREDCGKDFSWDVSELPEGGAVTPSLTVTGWIGFVGSSSQKDRGIDIFASEKAVELGSFFNYPSTHAQFARAHLVGEIHADFLDGDLDFISTARNSVLWESEAGYALQAWGQKTLRWAFERWVELRREGKETAMVKTAGFDKWLATRPTREQHVAQRMLKMLAVDEKLDPESALPLLEIVKSSVETVAFHELVDAIETEGSAHAAALLRLFDEWRVIEAREHLKLADGRVSVIEQLDRFIEHGALEVQQMQPLFEQNLWLIDNMWTEADGQTTYTKLLRANCPEPKDYEDKDRRLDILGVRAGGGVTVVELKRPEKTLSRRDLEQIEKYVDWARTQFLGTGSDAPKYVNGLLIVGKLSSLGDVRLKMERLQGGDIRTETYRDLRSRAVEYYGEAEKVLRKVAPEYASARKSKKK